MGGVSLEEYFLDLLLILLICGGYLLVRSYPSAVFLWGDEVERYNKTLQTRRAVSGIIIGVIIVGVLSESSLRGPNSTAMRHTA